MPLYVPASSGGGSGIPASTVDAKGDLIVATADDTVARKAVGTNGDRLVADSTSSDGLAWAPLESGIETGRYLATTFSGTGTSSQSTGAMVVSGLIVNKRQTFDRLAIEVTTAAAATSVLRLGIWQDNGNGKPGALVLDAGTVASDSTGSKQATISQSLAAGLYWVGYLVENASGSVGIRCASSQAFQRYANSTGSAGSLTVDFGWFRAGVVTGALPNPFGSVGGSTSTSPMMWMRAA